jgi:hypothetical protein
MVEERTSVVNNFLRAVKDGFGAIKTLRERRA